MNQRNNWSLKSWLTNITVEWRLRRRPHSYNFRKVSKQRRPAARTHQHCRVLNQQMFYKPRVVQKQPPQLSGQARARVVRSRWAWYFFILIFFIHSRISFLCVNTEPLISIGCQLGLLFYLKPAGLQVDNFFNYFRQLWFDFLWVPLGWAFFCPLIRGRVERFKCWFNGVEKLPLWDIWVSFMKHNQLQ